LIGTIHTHSIYITDIREASSVLDVIQWIQQIIRAWYIAREVHKLKLEKETNRYNQCIIYFKLSGLDFDIHIYIHT